jgi:hypothetical protein
MGAAQVNGQAMQHALINLSSSARVGSPFLHRQFSAISFSDEGAKEPVYDSTGAIIGYVIKPRKTDGKVKLKQGEWNLWRDWFMTQAALLSAQLQRPMGPGQVEVAMTLTCGVTLATSMQRRIRCMAQREAFDSTDDQNPLEVEVPLFIMDITDQLGRRFVERGETP